MRYFERFGVRINPEYVAFYISTTGVFCPEYIPDDLYYCKIDPYFNNWGLAEFIDNKCYYSSIFPTVKQPNMLAYRMNGIWFINSEIGDLKTVLGRVSGHNAFIKQATESEGGHGVTYCRGGANQEEIEQVIESIHGDIVIQSEIRQCAEMSRLNESSVNTVRVLSLLSLDGQVTILSCVARMGVNGAKVDNASSGGITCGIEQDGRLKKVAYSAKGAKFDQHPDTGLAFAEVKVPSYNNILEKVKELHPRVPHFRLVSWDFCVDDNLEPVLIEANLRYGQLDFHQLNNGPVFGNLTEQILQEVFCKGKQR